MTTEEMLAEALRLLARAENLIPSGGFGPLGVLGAQWHSDYRHADNSFLAAYNKARAGQQQAGRVLKVCSMCGLTCKPVGDPAYPNGPCDTFVPHDWRDWNDDLDLPKPPPDAGSVGQAPMAVCLYDPACGPVGHSARCESFNFGRQAAADLINGGKK
jgi:hypothetical protein